MKHFLSILMLIVGFSAVSLADTETEAPVDPDGSVQLQMDTETETDIDTAASPYEGRSNFQEHLQSQIINSVTRALENNPKLSVEEKEAITDKLRHSRRFGGWGDDENLGVGKTLIAAISILLIFGTPIMLVAAILYAGHRKRRITSETVSQYLASGQQVPPEVWRGLVGDTSPRGNLHKGMIMLGVGLGIFLCFWMVGSTKAAYLGLIPLFIGVAQLLIWKLESNEEPTGE